MPVHLQLKFSSTTSQARLHGGQGQKSMYIHLYNALGNSGLMGMGLSIISNLLIQ